MQGKQFIVVKISCLYGKAHFSDIVKKIQKGLEEWIWKLFMTLVIDVIMGRMPYYVTYSKSSNEKDLLQSSRYVDLNQKVLFFVFFYLKTLDDSFS